MNESALNTIVNNSFKKYGFSQKIADPKGGSGIQNCFDGLSVAFNQPLFWESKLSKGINSFNFGPKGVIEDHQWNNMETIHNQLKDSILGKYKCMYILGIYIPHKLFKVLFFHHTTLQMLRSCDKISIKKKELEKYINDNKCLSIQYESINGRRKQYIQSLNKLDEVII